MQQLPEEIQRKLKEREVLRKEKRFRESDAARGQIEKLGYQIKDTLKGTEISKTEEYAIPKKSSLILFGSGEIASSSVAAHDWALTGIGKDKPKIVVLSTPAGFQPNVHVVCEEIADFFEHHLQNFHPRVEVVYANTLQDANTTEILKPLDAADYIFAGPGSPTYAVRSLRSSLALIKIRERVRAGASLGLSSAAAIAFSKFALPVYEIYKAGFELYWEQGLNFYAKIFQELTVIPHFNNNEGGNKNDTSHAWMGKQRFAKLLAMLPKHETIWGIDEHTAVIIDPKTHATKIVGKGKCWEYTTR